MSTTFAIPPRWTERSFAAPQSRQRPRRIPNEFYPTPPEATRALLSVESFDGSIWEPACGDGAIAKILKAHGHAVVPTDLNAYGFGVAGIDFLKTVLPRGKHIVTNPPYGWGLADRFVEHALRLSADTGGKVAMLLNMASLCHKRRSGFWRDRPPARIYAIDDIVCWPKDRYGPPPRYFTKHRYCWAVWTPDHIGPPQFWWLSGAQFRNPTTASIFNIANKRIFS